MFDYNSSHYLQPDELGHKRMFCCLRLLDGVLVLHTMYYSDELEPRQPLAPPRQEIRPEELELATFR